MVRVSWDKDWEAVRGCRHEDADVDHERYHGCQLKPFFWENASYCIVSRRRRTRHYAAQNSRIIDVSANSLELVFSSDAGLTSSYVQLDVELTLASFVNSKNKFHDSCMQEVKSFQLVRRLVKVLG